MYSLPVKPTDLVLEVGSGHNPHLRSDVLCDSELFDNTERQRLAIRFDRPLVIAKGEKLPFANKAFDFVFCSQVIEHVADPVAFAKEISRVGKAGLITTPHITRERLFGWYYHRWFFFTENKTLYFLPKEAKEQTHFAHFMHGLVKHSLAFRRFLQLHEQELNIYYVWKDRIKIRESSANKENCIQQADTAVGELLKTFQSSPQENFQYFFSEKYQAFENLWFKHQRLLPWYLKQKFAFRENRQYLVEKLVCPECYHSLADGITELTCLTCLKTYPLWKGIPIFI